ncbi:glycosyltransferase family 4 protein [Candidatus Woesearchaeota archaeon]|nr:glycosyltransferase family 4 protein [Candidatus Woesearchaeota archaeon]
MEERTIPKKKLLIATDSFLPRWDGIARFLFEVVPFLSKDFDITIAAPRYPGKLEGFDDVKLVRFPVFKWKVADINPARVDLPKLRKLVKDADIVWTQSIGPVGAVSMHLAGKMKKPLIAFIHSVEWFLFSKSLKRFRKSVELTIKKAVPYLYNKCHVVMVPFEGMIPIIEEQGINVKKEIVHLGINSMRFVPPESRILAKERLGLDPNKLVVGYLGRFGREKDLPTLYKAFQKVHNNHPGTTLLLVGGEIVFDNMEDVKVFPATNDPVPYYQAMDIYVLPSLTETTSLTTMEAMSAGLPVVVTPVGLIPRYVEHKFNGFQFPCGSEERLALILEKLLKDGHVRRQVGKNARRTILQKHTWKTTAQDILDVLKRF